MSLFGHHALVTGGTQGVGGAIAIGLAEARAGVVIQGLHEDPIARQTLANLRHANPNCSMIISDLSGPTIPAVDHLFTEALKANPKIDLLVNNVGTFIDKPFLDMDFETYELTFRLNVAVGYFLTQRFARHWIENKIYGRVLFTGSINGQLAEPDHTAYDSSKGAVWMMVKSLCVALAPHHIRVNSIAPGLVHTPLTDRVLAKNQQVVKWMQLHTPNRKVPTADACAGAAVFLLSDSAEHIHGQTLLIDGGMSAWQQPDLPSHLHGAML